MLSSNDTKLVSQSGDGSEEADEDFNFSDWEGDLESLSDMNPDDYMLKNTSSERWFEDQLPEDESDNRRSSVQAMPQAPTSTTMSGESVSTMPTPDALRTKSQAVDVISNSGRGEDDTQMVEKDAAHDDQNLAVRFRDYQACQWSQRFEELMAYKREFGHCCVPHTSKDAPSLGRWVKRQRYQYKLWQEGRPESTMTHDRIKALESIGFVWESHEGTWEQRYSELQQFYSENGHSNVPSNHSNNKLATWVKYQRRQFKLQSKNGEKPATKKQPSNSSLTLDRIKKLQALGFEWQLRRCRGDAR